MKRFIFLDVDRTLLYDPRKINFALIEALAKKGLTDVYLFTNMDLKDISRQRNPQHSKSHLSRYELIKEMKKKGVNVLGVITPADPEYRDEKGNIKPIGSAYRELYQPTIKKVINNGPLKMYPFTSDQNTLADYHVNSIKWLQAHMTTFNRVWIEKGKSEFKPMPGAFIRNEKGIGKQLVARDDFFNYFKYYNETYPEEKYPPESIQIYDDKDYVNGKIITGDIANDNKALMMRLAIEQLTRCYGPIAILFFDDRKVHIDGCQEEVKRWNQKNTSTPVLLHTYQMKTDFKKAISKIEKGKYVDALIRFQIQTFSLQSNKEVSNAIVKHRKVYRRNSTRSDQINLINNSFNHFTANNWIKLATQAEYGNSPLFDNKKSLISAYYCFILSIYAAPKNQLKITLNNLKQFLQKHDYKSFIDDFKTKHQGIANFLFDLEKSIRHDVSHSPYAQELCKRKLSFLQIIKNQYPELDSKQKNELEPCEQTLLGMIKFCEELLKNYKGSEVTSSTRIISTLSSPTTKVVSKDVKSQTSKQPSKTITYKYGIIPSLKGIIKQTCINEPEVGKALIEDAKRAEKLFIVNCAFNQT